MNKSTKVKPEKMKAFINDKKDNARNSVFEPGIARFDAFQQQDDTTRFNLSEVLKDIDTPFAY